MKGFYDKGRVSGLLKDVPVYAVLVEDIGLRGAHFVAMRVSAEDRTKGGWGGGGAGLGEIVARVSWRSGCGAWAPWGNACRRST